MEKRPLSSDDGSALVAKRQKTDHQLSLLGRTTEDPDVKRQSMLQAPIMLLQGHQGAILTCKFNPDGDVLASGSHDKQLFLWRTSGDCENYAVLSGHKNAIIELHWTHDGEKILSASPDKTVRAWDANVGVQIKKMAEHDTFVNSCCPLKRGPPLVVSGGDDCRAKVWDLRVKRSIQTFQENYQITAVAFSEAGDQVYTGGIENTVKMWDMRKEQVSMQLHGHKDTITGMRVSPDGTHLLTNAMDNTLRVFDLRPYAPANRCVKVFVGHQHNYEKNLLRCSWSPDGARVTAGSADQMVYIWESTSRIILYKLPGHTGCVNEVVFHPKESIIASCSTDKRIYLGEISF